MLFEIFKQDTEEGDYDSLTKVGILVSAIESAVYAECKEDARGKAFRDTIKSIQNKLKGSRSADTRA
jgi:hypothetical protein